MVSVVCLDMWSVLCCVFHTWVVASNIAIGVYVLDMWSVLCVPYVGGASNIAIGLYVLGHVVSVVCSIRGC